MALLKTERTVINLDNVASIGRDDDGNLAVHYTAPRVAVPAGISYSLGQVPPVGSDHYVEWYTGEEAASLWDQIARLR